MPYDSTIQVAKDNPEGKLVDMDQVATQAGSLVQRQKAILVGDTDNTLKQLLFTQQRQLNVLRAILANLQQSQPVFGVIPVPALNESDFDGEQGTNNE